MSGAYLHVLNVQKRINIICKYSEHEKLNGHSNLHSTIIGRIQAYLRIGDHITDFLRGVATGLIKHVHTCLVTCLKRKVQTIKISQLIQQQSDNKRELELYQTLM